jgi:hypothetical protein
VETFNSLMLGFSVALQPGVLWYAFLGCLVGTLVGVLPGIGPLAGMSILLPVTYGLDATKAIVMLAGIYYGSQYGGSTTSILMRIPGEASSVMTCVDGYAMTQNGRAGPALAISAIGSFIAGTLGVSGTGCPSCSSRCSDGSRSKGPNAQADMAARCMGGLDSGNFGAIPEDFARTIASALDIPTPCAPTLCRALRLHDPQDEAAPPS